MNSSSKLSFILHPSSFILLELLSEGQCIVKYESSRHLCDDSRFDNFSRQPCTVHDAAAASHAWIAWQMLRQIQLLGSTWALLSADVHLLDGMSGRFGLELGIKSPLGCQLRGSVSIVPVNLRGFHRRFRRLSLGTSEGDFRLSVWRAPRSQMD